MRRSIKMAVGLLGVVSVLSVAGLSSASAASTWTVVPSPNDPASTHNGLSAVSCTGLNNCMAVGTSISYPIRYKTLAEKWDGRAWNIVPSPNVAGVNQSALSAISCPSPTSCFAVGNSSNGSVNNALVEQWNGAKWAIVTTPTPSGAGTSLMQVSCPSTSGCIAVGTADGKTLAEQWNGRNWKIVPVPNPPGATRSVLFGLSCVTVTNCTAVGDTVTGSTDTPLVEQWDGRAWRIVASASSPGAVQSRLSAVSCPSATTCTAVGSVSDGSTQTALVEQWNGSTWAIMATPHTSGYISGLYGVTCATTTSCTAVGDTGTGSRSSSLIEQWSGNAWAIVPSANPSGAFYSTLLGVSCKPASSCTAVGTAGDGGVNDTTLVER